MWRSDGGETDIVLEHAGILGATVGLVGRGGNVGTRDGRLVHVGVGVDGLLAGARLDAFCGVGVEADLAVAVACRGAGHDGDLGHVGHLGEF